MEPTPEQKENEHIKDLMTDFFNMSKYIFDPKNKNAVIGSLEAKLYDKHLQELQHILPYFADILTALDGTKMRSFLDMLDKKVNNPKKYNHYLKNFMDAEKLLDNFRPMQKADFLNQNITKKYVAQLSYYTVISPLIDGVLKVEDYRAFK